MKKLLFILAFVPFFANAQFKFLGGNVIKTNLFGLAVKNYNLTYERSILKKFSISLGYRSMPMTSMPSTMANQLQNTLNNDFIQFDKFEMGNKAITAELRFYPGMRRLRGFYVAPYYRQATFDLKIPINHPDYNALSNPSISPIVFNGNIKSSSYGLMIGKQTIIAKFLVLDFWIIGGHYGTSKGTLIANDIAPISGGTSPQSQLNDYVGTKVTQQAGPFKVTGEATSANSARIDMNGPWLGIRSIALSLGFKF